MKKFMVVLAACLGLAGAQAQQRAFTAQGTLQPLSGQAGQDTYLEVLGTGPGGAFNEYYGLNLVPGAVQTAIADHATALAAQMLNQYTQASARFSYDLSAANGISSSLPGVGRYEGDGFSLSLGGAGGLAGTVQVEQSSIFVRDRTSRRGFSVGGQGDGYPPATLPLGQSLVFTDAAPALFQVDLLSLMGTAGCCSSLHLSAPGPLPVQLSSPTEYRPVYMSLNLLGSRSSGDPVDGSLPASIDLARYDQQATMGLIFGGHYTLQVDAGDYATHDDYLAAKAWIDANIDLVNVELNLSYGITGLQAVPVPEPATAGLLAAGLLMLAGRRYRQQSTA